MSVDDFPSELQYLLTLRHMHLTYTCNLGTFMSLHGKLSEF